jgi:hypothetical protein
MPRIIVLLALLAGLLLLPPAAEVTRAFASEGQSP